MSTSNVLRLDDYRERREQRVKLAASLYGADPARSELLGFMARLASYAAADRAAIVWVDEYGPGLVHPHVVLDLVCDRPRRAFSVEPLHRAWESGVPGIHEMTGGASRWGDVSAWTLSIALGSDGARTWFIAADAVAPRAVLSTELRDRVMFLAGECSGIVLHRDLDALLASGRQDDRSAKPRFAGWSILQDIEGRENRPAEVRGIALRFIVARLPRLLVEDDLAIPADRMKQQAERAREELLAQQDGAEPGPEVALWAAVLDAFEAVDLEGLGQALLDLGSAAESRSQFHGATECFRTAHEIFAATGLAAPAADGARMAGRAQRRLALWDEAHRWYGVAREIAEAAGIPAKVAIVLDGVANIHRDRGNLPAARAALGDALQFAERSGDPTAIGRVYHGLLAVEHVAGNLPEALRYGWKAVATYPADSDRVQGLASLAGALVDAGQLGAAEDAWTLVGHLSGDDYYQLYARDALAHVAALRGDRSLFAVRAAHADAMGWENGPHSAKAEILYYRGLSYRALGEPESARAWLERAVEFADEHGFSRTLFAAEGALESLGKEPEEQAARVVAPPASFPEVTTGLRAMRLELVGSVR